MKKDKNTINQILSSKSILKSMVLLSIPLFLNNFIRSFQGIIDTFFVARIFELETHTQSALAAVALYDQVYNVFLAFGTGLAVAAVAIISQYLGANRKENANKYASLFVTLAFIIGIVITGVIVLSAPGLVHILGAREHTAELATIHFRIRSIEYAMVLFFMVYQAIRQASGNTLRPMVLNVLGILTNTLLIFLFVNIFNMGFIGLGLATVIGNSIFVPVMLFDLFKPQTDLVAVELKAMIPNKERLKRSLPFAVPAALGQAFSSIGFVVIQAFILYNYHEVVASAFAVGNRISNLLMTPIVALSTVSAVFIGTNVGNRQPERALQAFKVSRNTSFLLTVGLIAIAIPLRAVFIGALISDNANEILLVAKDFTFWLLLSQPFMALFQNYTAIFNGSGKPKNTLIMAIIRLWVLRLPILLTLHYGFNLGYQSVWFAMLASNVLVLVAAYFLKRKTSLEVSVIFEEEVQHA